MKSTPLVLGAAAIALAATAAHPATVTPFATQLPQSLYGLTSDAGALYFSGARSALRDYGHDATEGVIGKVVLTDGSVTILYDKTNYVTASGHVTPMQLATDGAGALYWADPDAGSGTGASFLSGTTSGAKPTMIFNICCGAGVLPGDGIGVALAGGQLYFSDATGGRVGVNPSGSSATQIGPTRYAPDFSTAQFPQITVSKNRIYLADSALVLGADGSGTALQQDQSAVLAPGVRWIATDGSSGFVDLSVGKIDHPRGVVAVGKFLYVTGSKTVWKVSTKTGKATILARDKRFQDLQGITSAHGVFYVADSQTVWGPPVNGLATATSDGPGIIWKIVP